MNTLGKMYTLGECSRLLKIDPKTLDKWIVKAAIVPEVGKADSRVRSLTHEQLVLLAREHGRSLEEIAQTEEQLPITIGAYKLLIQRLDQLEKTVQGIPVLLQEQEHTLVQQITEQQERALLTVKTSLNEQINQEATKQQERYELQAVKIAFLEKEMEQWPTRLQEQEQALAAVQTTLTQQLTTLFEKLQQQQEEQKKLMDQIAKQQQEITDLKQNAFSQREVQEQKVTILFDEIEVLKREGRDHKEQEQQRQDLTKISKEVEELRSHITDGTKLIQEQQMPIEQEKQEGKKKRSSRAEHNRELTSKNLQS